jgi:HSP20 family protein
MMKPALWEPVREFSRLRDEMDNLFGRVFGDSSVLKLPSGRDGWMPSVDVYEEEDAIVVKADLPGVKKENVNITGTENALTIEGQLEEEKEEKKDNYYSRERRVGRFHRTISMPMTVDMEKAKATFKDGIVTISLPKIEELPKGTRIEIEDGTSS